MAIPVYFATCRARDAGGEFTADFDPSGRLLYGCCTVLSVADESRLADDNLQTGMTTRGSFDSHVADELAAGPDHLLVSLHGFNYHHREAMMRAAANADWFARATPAMPSSVIAFSWPSLGQEDPVSYAKDWKTASHAGGFFGPFLSELSALIRRWRAAHPAGRVTLMAHSMGNHFFRAGMEQSFGDGRLDLAAFEKLFDLALLIAGDEDARLITKPNGLYAVMALASRTVVYFNQHDLALDVSHIFHGCERLGHVGAPDKTKFEALPIAFVDCSQIDHAIFGACGDPEGHQYYRLLPQVRDDIAAEMAGQPPERPFDEASNSFRLVAPAAHKAAAPVPGAV